MAEGDGKQDKLEDHVDVEQEKQKEDKKAAGLVGQDYDSTTEDEKEEAAVVDAVGTAIEEAVTKTEDKDKGPREVSPEPTANEVQEKELQASSDVDKEDESLGSEAKDATTHDTNESQL